MGRFLPNWEELVKIRSLAVVVGCAVIILNPGFTLAGNFKVVPIKVYFENDQKVQTLTLHNDSDSDVTLQFEAVEWRQDEQGKDVYEPTKALFIFPGIITVKAGTERPIKLGYQGPPASALERSYRVYMTELPVAKSGETSLQMALRLGVPVFVVPKKGKPQIEIERTTLDNGSADVHVTNPGNRHVYVKTIQVTGLDRSENEVFVQEASGWYVLPGVHRTFPVALPKDGCGNVGQLRVSVKFANHDQDQTPVSTTVSTTNTVAVSPCHADTSRR